MDEFEVDIEEEIERLRQELKRKQNLIGDKDKVISTKNLIIEDLNQDIEELERDAEVFKQNIDRLNRHLEDRSQEVDSLSRTIQEFNTSYAKLEEKFIRSTNDIKQLSHELEKTRKDLVLSLAANDDLRLQNQELSCQATVSRRVRRDRDDDQVLCAEVSSLKAQIEKLVIENKSLENQILKLNEIKKSIPVHQPPVHHEQTNEEMVQELYDLRAQVKTLSHRLSRRSVDEQISKLEEELKVTETSWKFERLHKERYARELSELEKQMAKVQKEKLELEKHLQKMNSTPPPPPLPPKPFHTQTKPIQSETPPPPPLPPKPGDENRTDLTAGIHFSMADEEGQLMQSNSILQTPRHNINNKRPADDVKPNYKIQKQSIDPMLDYKLRCERAKELARRNMQTKPLHQTSYPLELDTFETSNLTEFDIKKGKLNPSNQNGHRNALTDSSNKRKPFKKAEAFIV